MREPWTRARCRLPDDKADVGPGALLVQREKIGVVIA